MLARVVTAALQGIDAHRVMVEVDVVHGLPGWQMVGLPEPVVKESKERVLAALRNSGIRLPSEKVTINFAPADNRKRGTGFDLPVAVGLMTAFQFCPIDRVREYLFISELSLTGGLFPVNGILATAILAKRLGLKGLIVADENYSEASLVNGLEIIGCEDLRQVVEFLKEGIKPTPLSNSPKKRSKIGARLDFADVKGQELAKRAMEIAAAGHHNLLMIGPPGTGKTMLAERLPSILSPLGEEESLETTKIYSSLGLIDPGEPLMKERPLRAPHHSATLVGLFGGGSDVPSIGEISLAHHGVLFLDEFPEFKRDVIEMLRQPIESGRVSITRAGYRVCYPARFLLVAAMNPCRCGYIGHPTKECICSVRQVQSYRRRISGPLLDRIDLRVEVGALKPSEMLEVGAAESSEKIRERVMKALRLQEERYSAIGIPHNSRLSPDMIKKFCPLDNDCERLLRLGMESKGYSGRAIHRMIRVARTIADLDGSEEIKLPHLAESIQFHSIERLDEL